MIHEIGRELAAALLAQGCPFPVVDGPEQTSTATYARERIVIERDEDASDSFSPPRSQAINPKVVGILNQAIKITIYAQSSAPGAAPFEHRRRASHVCDLIFVALEEIKAIRKNAVTWTGGKFVQPEDLARSEKIGGAVYQIKLTWERGISKATWAGAIADEFTISSGFMRSTTHVSGQTETDTNAVETACGA